MTAVAPQPPGSAPPRRWGAGRITALVIGIVLLVPGLGLLIGGGALLYVDGSSRTADGFVLSASDHFRTSAYALTSDALDLRTGADWLPVSTALGTARVQVIADQGREVFVGIAPLEQAQAYLRGVGHTVVADIGRGASGSRLVSVSGGPPPGAPADQDIWASQASGPGTQRLTWVPADGSWMLVVMNPDGSAGVSVQARAGATVPSLGTVAWSILGTGLVVTLGGALLIVLAALRRPRARPYVAAGPPPPGPPAWIPPPRVGGAADVPSPSPAAPGTDPPRE